MGLSHVDVRRITENAGEVILPWNPAEGIPLHDPLGRLPDQSADASEVVFVESGTTAAPLRRPG